jgi:ABC-type multidrug transport system fused ATPase/permease subunit
LQLWGALASYVANYYTESVGQWVANDLRMRTYHHLQRLSLSYYDQQRTGALLSTITSDVQTIQSFASSATLGILVDLFTIVGMLFIMSWLNWDFTLIVLAVTPFLLLLVSRFKKAVKAATHEVRKQQANIVSVVQQDLESMRVVKAFGRQDYEQEELGEVSRAVVEAALKARRVKAMLSPIVTVTVAVCTGIVLWRGSALILAGTMTAGALTVFLSYLTKFFKPVKDLATMTNSIAQAAVGVDRVRAILDADNVIPESPEARVPESPVQGGIRFDQVKFSYNPESPRPSRRKFRHQARTVNWRRGTNRRRQVDDRKFDPTFLRYDFGKDIDRRRGRARLQATMAAQPDRLRSAKNRALPGNCPRQHRLPKSRRHA